MLKYIDKPYEEMTLDELKEERKMQKWLCSFFNRASDRMQFKRGQLLYCIENDTESVEARKENADAYKSGVISDRKYLHRKEKIAEKVTERENAYERWGERIKMIDMYTIHAKALVEELDDLIEKREYMTSARKKRKLPSSYGYDPRRRTSRTNYVRHDWGHTRETYEALHRKRKKGE